MVLAGSPAGDGACGRARCPVYRAAVPGPASCPLPSVGHPGSAREAPVPGPAAAAIRPPPGRPGDPAGRLVQRSVQARESWQYQRTSGQALPPSGTRRSVGSRMPHIQQDSTVPRAAGADIK